MGDGTHSYAPLSSPPPRPAILARWGMGIGAVALTLLAAVIAFWPQADSTLPERTPAPSATTQPVLLGIAAVEYATALPTIPPPPVIPTVNWMYPTAASSTVDSALEQASIGGSVLDGAAIVRRINPFTIQPARLRDRVVTYTVKPGDNLRLIADRFGISESTIIWSNERFYVNAMQVGMELTILPVNGVYHQVLEPQTIASIAEQYAVDPYAIIDSEYNTLFGASPQNVLPVGLRVVVPGGTGSTEPIYWDPGIEMVASAGSSGASATFGGDDPGACGRQTVTNGSPPDTSPIRARYTITQDYSWTHGGIDLAVPPGTSVYAAGGGTVVFAGWSTWGYGYAVVIAHGSTMSLYGHLNGPLVRCGQVVSAGQGIAVTGNSGNSSGPHLHFEIRGSDGRPVSPWSYQSF